MRVVAPAPAPFAAPAPVAFAAPFSPLAPAAAAFSPALAPSPALAAPVPAPALAAALARPAAAVPARPASASPVPAAAAAAREALSRETPALSALYDGARAAPAAEDPAVPMGPAAPLAIEPAAAAALPLGSGLRMAREEHAEWLASVTALLAATRTGRRVLRDIDALAAAKGRPTLLDVQPIGNNGEFRYDSNLLIMDSGHLKRDPYQSAPILAHELQHVLQRAMRLPTDALELEIESYTVESRVWSELGVEPAARTFARQARRHLLKDLPGFVNWLSHQYSDNIALYGGSLDAYKKQVEKKRVKAERARARTLKKKLAVERLLDSMGAAGHPDWAIEAHRREALEPLERSLRDGETEMRWIERDLKLLSEPESRERFRAYARGVIRRARSLSRS